MTVESPVVSYPNGFVSTFLPPAASVNSTMRTVQGSFPVVSTLRKTPLQLEGGGADVIVLHLGSRFMKLGFANQAFPKLVPHVLAKPAKEACIELTDCINDWEIDEEKVQERFAQRYKQARRKPPPNIYQSLINYNRQADFQEIQGHNDAFLLEWTVVDDSRRAVVGSAALHLNPDAKYRLFWPIQRGSYNCVDYGHARQVVDDLSLLWMRAIETELEVAPGDFAKYCVVIVVPDAFGRAEVKGCVEALLGSQRPFRAVTVIQESVASTFGSGVSSAVVVDCGAQKISVACVEDGHLVPESRVKLAFGGDEVTRLFAGLLKQHEFPYDSLSLHNILDWQLMDELKERCCTLAEDEIPPSAAVYEFYVRHPGSLTKQYRFKMFEERIIAPLAMFDSGAPWLWGQGEEAGRMRGLLVDSGDLDDPFTALSDEAEGESTVATSDAPSTETPSKCCCQWDMCDCEFEDSAQLVAHLMTEHLTEDQSGKCGFSTCSYETSDATSLLCHVCSAHLATTTATETATAMAIATATATATATTTTTTTISCADDGAMSIDEAVIASILKLNDSERIRRCLSSIILAGGSHLFSAFPAVFLASLTEQLPLHPVTALLEPKLFPNTRDLDARFLAWKGGAVASKLESTVESWITAEEWLTFGMRAVKERLSFLN